MDVEVRINKLLFDYDQIVIVGPVFPHEVVGFSGGNKYLFPGVSGPEILNFFHWLGAVVTNPMIIGNKWTPVRRVVDRAAALVTVPKLCFCLVVEGTTLAGAFAGSPEGAWDQASELSRQRHIIYKEKPFHTILSCAPPMYDELWVGGKCMYKLEPVLADGGELIIYAPHIHEVSVVHGALIESVGYHCRDYFLKQWDRFKDLPWGTLAHSTHVRGIGTFEDGVEHCRARVTLATGDSARNVRAHQHGLPRPGEHRRGSVRGPGRRRRAARAQGGRDVVPVAGAGPVGAGRIEQGGRQKAEPSRTHAAKLSDRDRRKRTWGARRTQASASVRWSLWSGVQPRSMAMNSSAETPACRNAPAKVPTFNSRCLGTTQPLPPRRSTTWLPF